MIYREMVTYPIERATHRKGIRAHRKGVDLVERIGGTIDGTPGPQHLEAGILIWCAIDDTRAWSISPTSRCAGTSHR